MKQHLHLIILVFSFLVTSWKCEKDDTSKKTELPAETQTGKNTFGCRVDGQVWLPLASFPYSALTADTESGILSIWADSIHSSGISISIRDFKTEGEYTIDDNTASERVRVAYSGPKGSFLGYEGKIIITKYDISKPVIAGRFWFRGRSKSGATIDVTEGRFDLSLK